MGQMRRRHPSPNCRELEHGGWGEGAGGVPRTFGTPPPSLPSGLSFSGGGARLPRAQSRLPSLAPGRENLAASPFTPDIDLNSLKVAGGEDARAGDEGWGSSHGHEGWECQGQNTAMTPSDMAGNLPWSPELIPPPLRHAALGLVPAPGLSPTGPGDLPAACLPDTPAPSHSLASEWGVGEGRQMAEVPFYQSLRQLRSKRNTPHPRTWGSMEPSLS